MCGRIDDEIYEDFRSKFPELFADGAKGIAVVDEDLMKNAENKVRWRNFIQGLVNLFHRPEPTPHSICHAEY